MDAVMTQGASVCNVDALSHEELKEHVHGLQKQSMQMSVHLHNLSVIVHQQAETMELMVNAHERGDKGAIETKLQELSDWRKARMKPAVQH
jgi:hypothetical protein